MKDFLNPVYEWIFLDYIKCCSKIDLLTNLSLYY